MNRSMNARNSSATPLCLSISTMPACVFFCFKTLSAHSLSYIYTLAANAVCLPLFFSKKTMDGVSRTLLAHAHAQNTR